MKKVIFVGGTSFSGSTFFHMILANDPHGFALGEIRWLFNPHRPYHVHRLCGCGDQSCDVWAKIYRHGEDRLYQSVFDLYPDVDFIVDSSKSVFWIAQQMENLAKQGIQAENIVIWKTPLEFANSSKKRNRLAGWNRQWLNYHRVYLTMVDEWRSLRYFDLANSPDVLKMTCNYLDIPYFDQKTDYWDKTHHSFGGNFTARFHLHNQKMAQSEFLNKSHDKDRMNLYRKVYYADVQDTPLTQMVQKTVANNPLFAAVQAALAARDVCHEQTAPLPSHLRMPELLLQMRRVKHLARKWWAYQKYGRFVNYE